MSTPVRRHRSSTATSRPSYPAVSSPTATELRALVELLTNAASTKAGPPSEDFLHTQANSLRRIRQLLIDSPDGGVQIKDLFRQAHGFDALLDTVRSVSGFYDPSKLAAHETDQFFELIKATLDVLSEALNEHSGNRRYFSKRVGAGGWRALEQSLASTGVGGHHPDAPGADAGHERLFGTLFAFALGEETMGGLFREIRLHRSEKPKPKLPPSQATENGEEIETESSSAADDAPTRNGAAEGVHPEHIAETLQVQVQSKFSGRELLQNPDVIPIIFNFWRVFSAAELSRTDHVELSISVLLVLRHIIALSTYNKAATHLTGVLSSILPLCFDDDRPEPERAVLKSVAESLVEFGINRLEDAYFLYREASASQEVADFLLQAIRTSRAPAFVQFDLSLHGYSSIELSELGRPFPPLSTSGYTLATWIRVDKYDPQSHTNIFGAHDSTQTSFVLAYIEKDSRHLILQTSVSSSKPSVRFRSVAFQEGKWYHIAIVHRRPKPMSSSRAALFVNGEFSEQVRCPYPSVPPPLSSSTESFASLSSSSHRATPMQAYLGTPQGLSTRLGRNVVFTKLSMASFHLFQEALNDDLIAVYQKTGPRYCGNYQDSLGSFLTYRTSAELNLYNELLHPGKEETSEIAAAMRRKAGNVLAESHIIFSISPLSVMDDDDRNYIDESQLIKSLSRDAAKNLQYYTRTGGNQIVINGAVPSINEALMQHCGVAMLHGSPIVVVPQAIDDASWRIAGCAAVGLELVQRAQTKDAILRSVEILLESIQSNWRNSETMEKESGFHVLAALLREKIGLGSISHGGGPRRSHTIDEADRDDLTLELLRIILRFIGYDEKAPADSIIINPLAYKILLVDTDMWRKCSVETQNMYYDQFVKFAQDSKAHHFTQKRLLRTRIVKRLLDALKGESLPVAVYPQFRAAFKALLRCGLKDENLRCLSLFITFALHDGRAPAKRTLATKKSTLRLAGNRGTPPPLGTSATTTRSTSPQQDVTTMPCLPRGEIGVKVLEIYAEILCDAANVNDLKRFARTVTNKVGSKSASSPDSADLRQWLLYLLAESDPRVIVLSLKILARLLVVHGSSYVKKFAEKTGGFTILSQRLKAWWNVPAIWTICFCILFGKDVAQVDFERDFDLFNLTQALSLPQSAQVVYPEVFPVIAAMLKTGLRTVVREQGAFAPRPVQELKQEAKAEELRLQTPPPNRKRGMSLLAETAKQESAQPAKERLDGYGAVLQTVIQFLIDIHERSAQFRDHALSSSYVQELLFVLYPVVVTSDSVSAETELHSRGSLTFEGQDVVIQPHSRSAKEQSAIVRTTVLESSSSPEPRGATPTPLRRSYSFILVSTERTKENLTSPRLESLISPPDTDPHALQIGNAVVQGLLEVIIGVFKDQVLNRKEFGGFGLFLKVPPGFQEHQAYFETYVLLNAMKSLSNTMKLDQKLMCEPRVLTNLSRYVQHMAEALFEGWFLNGTEPLLEFIGTLLDFLQRPDIARIKSVRLCNQAIATIRTVFLRIVLWSLSDLTESDKNEETAKFLDKMIYWQTIILSPDNADTYFLRLLCYLLYTKLVSKHPQVRSTASNLWRLLMVQKQQEIINILGTAPSVGGRRLSNGFVRLTKLPNDLFLEWIDQHRSELDEFFFGSMAKTWDEYVTDENKKTEETAKTRVSKRKDKLKQWHLDETNAEDLWHRHENSTTHWRINIHTSERLKYQRSMQDQQENLAFVASKMQIFERRLREPCSLFERSNRTKWELDETEGRNRMRKRILPDSKQHREEYQPKRKESDMVPKSKLKLDTDVPRISSTEQINATPQRERQAPFPSAEDAGRPRSDSQSSIASAPDEDFEMVDDPNEGEDGFEDKNRKVMRSLEMGDQVQHVNNVARIVGLEALEGLLIIGNDWLYLLDNFFQRSDGEIVRVWQAPAEERDPYVQMISGRQTSTKRPQTSDGSQTTRHWRWSEVISISKRRFLFRDVALEIFFTDGRSYLLTAMSPAVRNDLYNKLIGKAPHVHDPFAASHLEHSWRLESLRNPEEAPRTLGSKFANVFNSSSLFPATKKWLRGEISNFNYLMFINTLAGRTFNDLTQYPVFPWVLADYTSEQLDLTNPRTFRDFSKPMGCQIASREAEFRDRYQTFAEMGDQPAFHYGTHYSSAMIVSSYLIRLQPFVQSYLLLQGGSFDHADRLFYSVEKAWLSASRDNMTDVRELIPEFFYLPEFLGNLNGYNFGARQNGERIDNVVLPPWAKGDPEIFIAKHREALESPYVSQNLHHWIDLVFGFKQRGEAAVEATNVFHYLSYHGAKDLDSIADSVDRLASIMTIHNFGQTPYQIFQRPHPPREEMRPRSRRLDNAAESLTRLPDVLNTRERVASLLFSPKHERILCSGAFRLNIPPNYDRYMEWGFTDGSVRIYSADNKKLLGIFEHVHQNQISCAVFVDSKTLITAGTDCAITVWSLTATAKELDLQPKVSLFGHRAPVTVLAVSPTLSTLLSADTDGRAYLWDLNRSEFVRELGHGSVGVGVECARINNVTGTVALCRGSRVLLYTLNGRLLLDEDVCDTPDADDCVAACAWYDGVDNEWLERNLLFTGHRKGVVNVWNPRVNKDGKWMLELVKRLNHVDPSREDGSNFAAAITCVLPRAQAVYTGDDEGRVFEWECVQRGGSIG